MALFTSKADAELALCTSFYQLTINPLERFAGSELDKWIAAWMNRKYGTAWKRFSDFAPKKILDVAEYQAFLRILRVLMDALAEHRELTEVERDAINQAMRLYLPPPSIKWNEETRKHSIEFLDPHDPRGHVLMEVIDAMERENMEQTSLFGKCEECKNPFLVQKEGQRFCSQRCRARTGERRRYAVRFADYQPTRRRPNTGQNTVQSQ